jgi:rhomboid protease GluP
MNREGVTLRVHNLFLPLIGLSAAFTIGYSFLNWLLVAKNGWIPIDEDMANIWLPGTLAWILVISVFQRRLRLLNLRDKRNNLPFLYHFAAVAVVAAPAIIAQGYVRTATGDITHVEDAALIPSNSPSKFYVADNVCMHLNRPVSHGFVSTSGKGNQTLVFNLYVLTPVCSTTGTTDQKSVWLGLKFHQTMNNSASDADKNVAYDAFVRESLQSFNAEDSRNYQFLETLGHNSDRKRFEKTLQLEAYDLPFHVILVPHRERFENRSGNRLEWLLWSIVVGPLLWLGMIFLRPIQKTKTDSATDTHSQTKSRPRPSWLTFFTAFGNDYGLSVLLCTNIAVFLVMAFSGLGVQGFDSDDLMAWGANYRPAIHGLGILRLITSQFVHGGLIHLINNLYGLLFAGLFLLPVVTKWRLIACYLLCGLGGSVASVLMHPATISVGASGAIFGLFGILLTLSLLRDTRLEQTRKFIFINAGIFVALNLAIGATTRGIDNAAHLGGLLTGAVLAAGLFLSHRLRLSRIPTRPDSAN